MEIRLLEQVDMTAAQALLHPGFKLSAAHRRDLPALWQKWMKEGVMHGAAVEDRTLPAHERLLLIGMTAFLEERFLEEIRRCPIPHLVARIYELAQSGHSPLLSRRQIVERNRSDAGLDLVMLHSLLCSYEYDNTDVQRLINLGKDAFAFAFAFACSGFHYSSFTFNFYSAFPRDYGLQLGMDIVASDLSDPQYPASVLQLLREHVKPGSYLSYFFLTREARFDFTPGEQAILARALLNASDIEIADSLAVAHDTVRKQWRSIFARVVRIDPSFFPESEREASARGPEKRRHLIHYLRQRLEEIRPHPPKAKLAATAR